ncbi:hypothetical protein [Symmachiella macrocystis]|uniref:hypothetical protein n=1 Tax=Symmachiella macrocystis TaxID=2527985 RepID=UPI0011B5809E|nr:hypothetical protein [Symmachiella macrocystis]
MSKFGNERHKKDVTDHASTCHRNDTGVSIRLQQVSRPMAGGLVFPGESAVKVPQGLRKQT